MLEIKIDKVIIHELMAPVWGFLNLFIRKELAKGMHVCIYGEES